MNRLVSMLLIMVLVLGFSSTAYANDSEFVEQYAVSLTGLAFRDANGKQLEVIPKDDVMTVLGVDKRDGKRDWVSWNGKEGSVIRTGIKYLGITVEEYAKRAVIKTELNMRIPETYEFMLSVPMGSEVKVLGQDSYHEERWIVDYQGIVGSVVKSGVMIYANTNIIIVSISDQTVKMIKNGRVLCYTKTVTGMCGVTDTPRGLFTISEMLKNTTLKGDDYETDVKYWMRFYYGCGLHDAWWRSHFGGNIYTYDGSHGCVNLPSHIAKAIYENAYIGYKVMVY